MKLLIKLLLQLLFLLLIDVTNVFMMRSEKPVHQKLWRELCNRGGHALNDCNWCKCDAKLQYTCTARVCSEVDMFGHFNDAIRQVDVGMEGHGVWRSTDTICQPGVHYRKGELLCVCTEDGTWPSPVCRDVFQILYSVEVTKFDKPTNQSCFPTKLYQFGCNTCYCPESGQINASLCTKRDCSNDITQFNKEIETLNVTEDNDYLTEIYAACQRAKKYQLGCKTCVCLPSNRLLCDNCTSVSNLTVKIQVKEPKFFCNDMIPGKKFKKNCNVCYCDKNNIIYCTVLKCLDTDNDITIPEIEYTIVTPPVDDTECIPGTIYNRKCNTCKCFEIHKVKYFACTVKFCDTCNSTVSVSKDSCGCVEGTRYEKRCLICQCMKVNGKQLEICTINKKCEETKKKALSKSLSGLHGYCEPLHIYEQDCNRCKCLTEGNMIACTSKICSTVKNLKNIVVEFIPFIQKNNSCPKGHKYKVNCNLCHCLSNGNALCTTNNCKQN